MHPSSKTMPAWPIVLLLVLGAWGEYRKLIPKCLNACLTGTHTNCHCDSKCSLLYNDCCLDAPYRTFRPTARRHPELACVFVHGENDHFWMVDACAEGWNDTQQVVDKCHEAVGPVSGLTSDAPSGGRPFTNPERGLTYKNFYCALCNGEAAEDLLEWRVKALCVDREVTPEDVLSNFTYLEERGQWGVWRDYLFSPCHLLFQRPLGGEVRSCVPAMVSSCPSGWKNIATRRKCKSYVDPVKWREGPVYRNVECAACHGRNLTEYECHYDVARGSSAVMLDRAMPVDLGCAGQWLR